MICGEITTLRAIEERDVERLRAWRNHPELMGLHFSDLPVSDIEQNKWYQAYATSRTKVFIVDAKQQEAVGYVLLKDLDHKNRQAEIGIHLDPSHQGKGYGKDAFLTLVRYCFAELNLHRVCLQVFAFNERAAGLYRKLGFVEEGRLRECFFTQGAYQDIIVMSVLESEFQA
ncbi:MAG: GNAT family protein [Candidatus Hinthialibacter antarcticus]|nr:GNAT family protein [Candidatus Hinthialibacter antarcticus]